MSIEELRRYYKENEDFKAYVDKYSTKEEITPDQALTHAMVREAAAYYKEAIKGKLTETGIKVGCGGADATMGECK